MASLLDRRLILREAGSGTREILEKHLAARDLDLDDFAGTLEVASIPAIKLCVRAGTGITFMYRAALSASSIRASCATSPQVTSLSSTTFA